MLERPDPHDPETPMRIRPLGTILAALLAAPLAPAAPAPASAPIRPVAQATASPEPTIALRAPVRVDVGSVRQALDTPGGAVAVPLPDRPDLIAVAERVAQAGADAWTATARGDDGSILYVASRSGVLIADVVAADGAVYQLRAAADGLHEVRLMDPEPFAPCGRQSNDHAEIEREGIPVDLASLAPPRPERVARGVGACVEDGSVVDVLVAYTPDVVAAEGGEANVLALIDLAILQTNEAFAASGVASVLRLVGAVEVPRTWSTSSSATILNDLATPGSGTLDEIHALRDAARADLVSLIVSNLDVCGRAYIAVAPGPTPMPELGFSVVSASCATAPIKAFAHEIGHNAGLAHARSVAPCEANGTDFAHGWADPGDAFRTIMASDGTGPVIGRFSSASLLYDGLPTGDAENDNAATLALTLPLVANYRSLDCNANGLCDADEIAQGASDLDGNGVIDSCDPDLNHNGVPDAFDIASAASADANANGIPDEAEPIRLYVDPAAAGDRLGDDWANARHDLQTALSIAERSGGAVQEIWVAAGIYTPAPAPYRARPFQMVSGVAIYGGFAGTEQSLAERDWRANPTILSGDLLQNDAPGFGNIADNSVSVVWASYTDDTAVLDGFFIEGGNCRYDLSDCWWTPFSAGGGIRCFSGDGVIRNCVIRGNSAQNGGGGVRRARGHAELRALRLHREPGGGADVRDVGRRRVRLRLRAGRHVPRLPVPRQPLRRIGRRADHHLPRGLRRHRMPLRRQHGVHRGRPQPHGRVRRRDAPGRQLDLRGQPRLDGRGRRDLRDQVQPPRPQLRDLGQHRRRGGAGARPVLAAVLQRPGHHALDPAVLVGVARRCHERRP
jgi:hypothetical protein